MSGRDGWTVLRTADGSATLVHPEHGQACHSDAGAWLEACERYARPCRLAERAAGGATVRLLDVGTGPGWNLAAALAEVERVGGRLEAWTLEHDPSVLRTTLASLGREASDAPFEPWHAPVRAALAAAVEHGEATLGARSRLVLRLGDARATLPALPSDVRFDAVFLDPFSPRVEPELWARAFLADVAARMAPGSLLSTYSASLTVRVALAAAGLRVGPGPAVARKAHGTLASPDAVLAPLDARTARKLVRRLAKEPRASGRSLPIRRGSWPPPRSTTP